MKAYPLKFRPILKEKIWGGTKLKSVLSKKSNAKHVGESWEISGVEGDISEVANGSYAGTSLEYLMETYKDVFVGQECYETFGTTFPLLIKFLDAQTALSVQVHPDDQMAKRYHGSLGKTEMWYVVDHDEDAEVILGLNSKTLDTNALQTINQDNVGKILNRKLVSKGDSYFIPAGQVHAIGAGVLAAEIQQTSDVTYRIYDWDRKDSNGNKRQLHLEKAMEASKYFDDAELTIDDQSAFGLTPIAKCAYFETNKLEIEESLRRDYSALDSFVIFICVEGGTHIIVDDRSEYVTAGETVLIPANAKEVIFYGDDAKLLEVYLPTNAQETLALAS
jgi:mannose-6-phosphate isomerase